MLKPVPRLTLPALLATLALLTCAVPLPAQEEDPWVLRFEDDFEREELGDPWLSSDGRIVDGRLLFGTSQAGSAGPLMSFPGDVKIEFEAEAWEGRAPCDLSLTFAANTLTTFPRNYFLAFGGASNTANFMMGGRNLVFDGPVLPDLRIEPGRVYQLTGIKEGTRLQYFVDGQLLLEGTDDRIMGGPAFDHVALVTWHGMYADNVKIYERRPAHPDTPDYVNELLGLSLRPDRDGNLLVPDGAPPRLVQALEAYNSGNLEEAEDLFQTLTGETRAAGLAYVYGHLHWNEKPDDFPRVAELFAQLAEENPDDDRLQDYAWAADKFANLRVYPRDYQSAVWLHSLGTDGNPFYDKATLFLARYIRATGQEGGDRDNLNRAQRLFEELRAKAPEHPALRQLTGESIPWGDEYRVTDPEAPEWAALLGEMYARQLDIMEWWFTERQYPDGQLGGGWGDDVEILRSWGPFATISDASPAVRDGIGRLADGVWNHLLQDGFAPGIGDVEHQAEPSADSLPTMLMLEYGDPFWFERTIAGARKIKRYYTGIDDTGYVRFKSGFFGGNEVSPHLRDGGDNYYSSRAMKHVLWPAWYGNRDAEEFYLDWLDGWIDNTMAAKYTKPAGMPPANIWYPSGDIAPPNGKPWYDKDWNIYGCCWPFNHWYQDMFLSGYALTEEPYYLQPFHAWMMWQQMPIPETDSPPDLATNPDAWIIRNAHQDQFYTNAFTQTYYRWLTNDPAYDTIILPRATAALRLHLTGDLNKYLDSVRSDLEELRYNYAMHTQEVLQTDRARLSGSRLSFGAYTGGVRDWIDGTLPTMAVTWDVPHHRFAALVVNAAGDHVRVWIYNLTDEPLPADMRLWRLPPGEYTLRQGAILPGGDGLQRQYDFSKPEMFSFETRGEACSLTIPPKQEWCVDLRLVKAHERPEALPDPAISTRDVRLEKSQPNANKGTVLVSVHNLGSVPVENLDVAVVEGSGGNARVVARRQLANLPGCVDFEPAVGTVHFEEIALSDELQVVLDLDNVVPELYEGNNRTVLGGFDERRSQ